jgi:DNA polymerase III psi subunit
MYACILLYFNQVFHLSVAWEADLLHMAQVGRAAKQWKLCTPTLKGNMCDHHATEIQLLLLANLESHNALLLINQAGRDCHLSSADSRQHAYLEAARWAR